MEGRIAVHSQDQVFSGGIAWVRDPAEDVILLSTPLGQGVAEIRMSSAGVMLSDRDGRRHQAHDGQALVKQVLGWDLPLAGLGHWVTGRPDPGRPHGGEHDAMGRWQAVVQDGWRIEYGRYGDSLLPGRMVARRGDGLEIRLVVDSWQPR